MNRHISVMLYCTSLITLAFLATLAASEPGQSIVKRFADPVTTTAATTTATMNPKNLCNLRKSSAYEKKLLAIIDKFTGRKFSTEDDHHTYTFGVCVKAADNTKGDFDGFIQVNKNTSKTVVIGRFSDVDVEGAAYSIRLVYKNGDPYPNACNKTLRSAVIYFMCATSESFSMIEENNERDEDCGYIFELKTPAVCDEKSPCVQPPATSPASTTTSSTSAAQPNQTTTATVTTTASSATNNDTSLTTTRSSDNPIANKSHWGVFSIVFIVIFSIAVVYLALGTVYLRLVRKARGWEQVPHWYVWHSIGNKSADCCNYICRCGQRQSEVHSYENINDRMSDDDENLLNM